MKCYNMFCQSHHRGGGWDNTNCCYVTKSIMRNCEARKRYNRTIKVEIFRIGKVMVGERNKYYGRD